MTSVFIFIVLLCCCSQIHNVASADYGSALTKSLLYFEGQRSGKLPPNQRVNWRGDSALNDGKDAGIDLVGGYYDAGDNLKLGFPLAFTITMLSWSTIEFREKLAQQKELQNALGAIRWGTDYLMKAHPQADVLYGEIGDPDSDHSCWQRPEDMTTSRASFKIDDQHPGSDLAAETAAALAAASIAFQPFDKTYAYRMLQHAIQLFDFANNHKGLYSDSIPPAKEIYSSSGYQDELLWAAAWLQRATNLKKYLDYLGGASDIGGPRSEFSWDDKYIGAHILVAKLVLDGKVPASGIWAQYKTQAEQFICSCAQKSDQNVQKTPGGWLWFLPWNNNQYVATATFAMSVYSNYLSSSKGASLQCRGGVLSPNDLTPLVRAQVDYILGSNPRKISYMVGYGTNFPQQIHHRAASIVSIKQDKTPVTCKGGFQDWYNRHAPNPNTLVGAVVSADVNDNYQDSRGDFQLAEPATVTNAPLVGVLAYLA
ncbi:endoglucanase 13 [Cajanus cajan]|uniref:Endoglucanase n=1 Tax=Cajanus cajan TaxID=3821 RepID=A0A151R3H3_CAJCA|nr:endoglucanase 13 [Cajanus cajan]KYP37073.1 Endoglucanase 13 [Cajanus cajan]